MPRIGFSGAGFIAGIHADLLASMPDARVVAVFEPDAGRAEAFAAKTGARAVPSYEALLDEVDAVYVCSPNLVHAEMTIAALEAGKHVFSEKPPALSLADVRRVRDAAERARGVYQLGLNQRFAPVHRAVRERIASGALTPRWAHVKMNRGQLLQPPWVADASLTGGFLFETAIHVLDVMMWLFGPVEEVVCRAAQTCAPQLDDFAMLLTFQSGVTTTFCSSGHTTPLVPFQRLEVYGDYATAVTSEADSVTFQLAVDAQPETVDASDLSWSERWGYRAEDEAFLAAARDDAPAPVSAADAERVVALIEACYRAAESREVVRL
ncbi:MAG: Gfo/Idh/MocA family oxidoreductase [Dehalococcoidia bacterium]